MVDAETVTLNPREIIINSLLDAAASHEERLPERLVKLDYDPSVYKGQDWETLYVPGVLTDDESQYDAVVEMACYMDERTRPSIDALLRDDQAKGRITNIGEALESGKNVALAGIHGSSLLDPGIELIGVYGALHEIGYHNFRLEIMTGKMLAYLGYIRKEGEAPIPTMDIMTSGSHGVYITVPLSESTKALTEDKETGRVISVYNGRSGAELSGRLKKSGQLLVTDTIKPIDTKQIVPGTLFGIQLPGTTNKDSKVQSDTVEIGAVAPETARLLLKFCKAGHTFVQGAVTWLDNEPPVLRLFGGLTHIDNEQEIYDLTGGMVDCLNEFVEGKQFRYLGKVSCRSAVGAATLNDMEA